MENKKNIRKDRTKSHIPFRLNLLFFIIFLLFVALIMRTGYLQIIKGEEFKAEVERTESTIIRGNVPRGEMYDKQLRPLVANEAKNTIRYTRGSNTKIENMAQVAYNLAYLIDIPHKSPFDGNDEDLRVRDLKDYFYAANSELMTDRINAHLEENNISANNFSYSDSLELISEAELMDLTTHELKTAAIFTKMNGAYALSTVNVKNDEVTQEEIAKVSENALLLPGITTGHDWERTYPQGDTLTSVFGRVSTEEQGLPQDQINAYLARGYSRNDRVGAGQIEEQYEDVLSGSKSRASTETDTAGDIISEEQVYAGSKGHNLVLTIDMEFQEKLDQIVLETLGNRKGLNDSVYAVAMDPNTGDILGMSGKRIIDGKIEDHALGVIQSAFEMGSSVKGATVLAGYMDGAITLENNTMLDTPLRLVNSNNISSLFNRNGSRMMNDITALEYSSNVYMAKIAMRMGGYWDYQQDSTVPINASNTIDTMRYYYRQFGLGSNTGIDLPSESIGLAGQVAVHETFKPMFQSFGQHDTYTVLQLGQFISTIANGGTRLAPRLVSEIRETDPETGGVGKLVEDIEPKIMNTIDVTEEQMERVQYGHYRVVNGNYGYGPIAFGDAEYEAAGKTGTAEASYYGSNRDLHGTVVTNMTYVGYAPYDDPEIAIAVAIPYLPNDDPGSDHTKMSRKILDAYFKVGDYAGSNSEETTEDEE